MNTRKWLNVGTLVVLATLALAVGLTQAQGPGPEEKINDASEAIKAAAAVSDAIPIQGQLTDNGDNPLDGNHSITLRLYETELEGAALCTDTKTVNVNDGLFNAYLEGCASHFDGSKQLYLGVTVESDEEMTPRQPLFPVPYAMSLRPGAEIRGSSSTTATVYVVNTTGVAIKGGSNSLGVYGVGGTEGVYGQGVGVSGAGVYGEALLTLPNNATHGVHGVTHSGFADSAGVLGEAGVGIGVQAKSTSGTALNAASQSGTTIYAGGTGIIRSAADTEIAVSPLNMIAQWESTGDIEFLPDGVYMEVRPTASASSFEYVQIPVNLPSRLFGAATRFDSIRICYKCDQAASFVSTTIVNQGTDSGTLNTIINDTTDRTNTDWECYTVTADTPETISGSLYLQFSLNYAGTGSTHDIRIGNITLTLNEM